MLLRHDGADGKGPGGDHHAGRTGCASGLGLLPQVAHGEQRREPAGGEGDGQHQPGSGSRMEAVYSFRMVKEVLIVMRPKRQDPEPVRTTSGSTVMFFPVSFRLPPSGQ